MKDKIKLRLVFFTAVFAASILTAFALSPKISDLHKKMTEKIILNRIKGYNKKSMPQGYIYYTKKDEETAELTALTLSCYMPLLEEEFDIKAGKPVIVIYPNESELKKAIGSDKAPIGAYYAGIIHILSPVGRGTKEDFMKNGPVVHELVHYIVDKKTNGNYYVWFSEGTALYYEYKYLGCEWHSELQGKTDEITLKQLESDFKGIDEISAYRRSFELIRDELEGANKYSIVDLCEKYRKNNGFD